MRRRRPSPAMPWPCCTAAHAIAVPAFRRWPSKQYLHGEAGFLLEVAEGIGERSMVNCTEGATSPVTTGRIGRYQPQIDRSLWRDSVAFVGHCWRCRLAGRGRASESLSGRRAVPFAHLCAHHREMRSFFGQNRGRENGMDKDIKARERIRRCLGQAAEHHPFARLRVVPSVSGDRQDYASHRG